MLIFALLLQTVHSGLINPGTPAGVPHSFDCAVRQFAWEYGTKLIPTKGAFADLRDALQVDTCNTPGNNETYPFNTTRPAIRSLDYKRKHGHRRVLQESSEPSAGCTFFVDSKSGSDSNDGSINSPLATLPAAVMKTRQFRNNDPSKAYCSIYLRSGTYYLSETLSLLSVDSNLLITSYKTEQVSITGARSLGRVQWSEFKRVPLHNKTFKNFNNVYSRAIPGGNYLDTTFLGKFTSTQQCQDASFSSNKGPFYSWTWHDTNYPSPNIAGHCFGIRSRFFSPVYENLVWSGTQEFSNIWMTSLKQTSNLFERDGILYGLRVNSNRGIRARYPNGDPEIAMQWNPLQTWIILPTKWKPPAKKPPATDIIISPNEWPGVEWPRTDPGGDDTWTGEGDFGLYYTGLGGTCDDVEPPYGYWCSNHAPRGIVPHMHPTGVYYDQTLLPNTPYASAEGAIVHTWRPFHWYTVQFEVGTDDGSMLEFSRGGFQGGEGFTAGAEWWIENVMEELDAPNEWFYDKDTKVLYYFHNDTSLKPPPSNWEFSIPTTKILINLQASQVDPIKNVRISGITFKDAAYTYMDPHGLPSGGDWALERRGAILMEGAVNSAVTNCKFTRLDGNAVFLSGFNRYVNLTSNEFEYLGANAMAAWGYSGGNNTLPKGVGPDGRSGDQPRFTRVESNVVKEIGIWQKQSSMWFQAVSCQNLVKGNVFFNGPRAAINFNDGFGGASVIEENLLVNTCRESGDHGPYNGWDRVPYITNVRTGKPSVIPATNVIQQNFMMSTYQAYVNVDADDGQSYIDQTKNFFVYGDFGLKSDFGGHDHRDFGNIHAYVANAWGSGFSLPAGMQDAFFDNTVVLRNHNGYLSSCTTTYGFNDSTIYGNKVYNSDGKLNVCNTTLENWVRQGHDKGTTVSVLPSDAQVIQWGKKLLGM